MDYVFSQHDLSFLDDVIPEKDKKKKEDEKKKKKKKQGSIDSDMEDVSFLKNATSFLFLYYYYEHFRLRETSLALIDSFITCAWYTLISNGWIIDDRCLLFFFLLEMAPMTKQKDWKLKSTKHLSDTKKFCMIARKLWIFYEGFFFFLFSSV